MGEMLAGIRAAMPGSLDIKFTWVPSAFLTENRVSGWSNMPVWVPAREGNDGWSRVSVQKAVAAGLTYRPLADTAKATVDWHLTRPAEQQNFPRQGSPGILPAREAELLAAWKARAGA
jgi:2'-hydroxyisoflavone reductase